MKKTLIVIATGLLLATAGCAQQPTKGETIVAEMNTNPKSAGQWGELCDMYIEDSYETYQMFLGLWRSEGGAESDPLFAEAWNGLQQALIHDCGAY